MLPLRILGLLVLMFSPCDADSGCPDVLSLDPPEVLAEYGESVTVSCSSAENYHNGMYWRVGDREFPVQNMALWSFNLTDWNVTAECILKLNDTHNCSKDLNITVYKNPEGVSVFPTMYEPAVEGREHVLQCDVVNVAPVQHLTVTWYRGNETIRTDYSTHKTKRLVSESFTLAANFSRGKSGTQVRCEAQLDFGRHGSQPAVISNVHTVFVHYAPELKNKTEDVYMYEGDNVTLYCEAEGNPAPAFHWSLVGVNLMKSTNYLNITRATSAIYNCTATNKLGSTTKQIHIHVMKMNIMGAPAAITTPEPSTPRSCPLVLTPAEIVVRFGDPVSVNCSTSVTGVFKMGWEATSGATSSTDNVIAWKAAKVKEWVAKPLCYLNWKGDQCYVMLDITVYKTPDNVSVSALDQGPMVAGTEYRLKCDISNVAPVQKLKLRWYRGNETVHTEMFNGTAETPVDVSSTLRVTPERDHDGALFRCEAELHLGQNGSELGPTVTSSPYTAVVHYEPLVKNCPESYAGVEHEFSIDSLCEFDGNPPPTVLWYYEKERINASEPLTRTQSGEYTAAIVNRLGSSNISVFISIEYHPSFTCGNRYEVKENDVPQCEAAGRPPPRVTWFKGEAMEGGKEVAAPKRWTKNDRGTYLLKATNKHGEATHRLYVDVFYAPVFDGNYSKEVKVIQGDNVTFNCSADGHPPPDMKWTYGSEANVTVTTRGRQKSITVTGATSTNAGTYVCNANNTVGVVTRTVTLVVKDRPKQSAAGVTVIWWLLIILAIVLILIIIVFVHRSKKQGQYAFVPAQNHDSGIPMAPQSNGVKV
ncbi:intercellular adhesion molecule 1 [Anarhichas minor]|uniref:intercellular adhesion molecule 1 n=1 Tax=Anarhichas minor TaxID=65739 RepID=UPI003F73C2CD